MSQDRELERFKSAISLADYAMAQGYELDQKASSKHSKVLKAGGDKIVVSRSQDGHDVYFNVRDEKDAGSVIDFAQQRSGGKNLGQIRKELRTWSPDAKKPAPRRSFEHRPEKSSKDLQAVQREWHTLDRYTGTYLAYRGIDKETVERFGVKQDKRGNAVFEHRRQGGEVCGLEKRNQDFKGFSEGGERGLWAKVIREDQERSKIDRIVITESPIDAMSHAQMFHGARENVAYIAHSGSLSPDQVERISQSAQVHKCPVQLAHDRDPAGEKMAAQLKERIPEATRHAPERGKDWNEQLQAARAAEAAAAAERARQMERPRDIPRGMSM
jgi:5S rRNA maturation endonuclease (ribonuclease M5)